MMRKVACLMLLVGGCSSDVFDLPAGAPLPAAPGRIFTPGVYTGTNYCRFEVRTDGVSKIWVHAHPVDVTINSEGDLILNGDLIWVGNTTTGDFERFVVDSMIDTVTEATRQFVFESDGRLTFECGNTCASARNGLCEEGSICELGEDCDDCGPLMLDGSQVCTAKRLSHMRIELTMTAQFSDPQGAVLFDGACWTIVSP